MTTPHFVSGDTPEGPAIDALVAAGRGLAKGDLHTGVVSARHGHRCIVSQARAPLCALAPERFSEVVDYDPRGDRLVLIGDQDPGAWGAVHALAYRAREETGAMLQVDAAADHPAHGALPVAERGSAPVETTLAVLELLREHSVVSLDGRAVLAVGATVEAARGALVAALEGAAVADVEAAMGADPED